MLGALRYGASIMFCSAIFSTVICLALVWPLSWTIDDVSKGLAQNVTLEEVTRGVHVDSNHTTSKMLYTVWSALSNASLFGFMFATTTATLYPSRKSIRTCVVVGGSAIVLSTAAVLGFYLWYPTAPSALFHSVAATLSLLPILLIFFLVGRQENEPNLVRVMSAFLAFSTVGTYVYQLVIFPLYFSTKSFVLRLLLRTVVHTLLKALFIGLCFRVVSRLKHAQQENLHIFFLPFVAFMSMAGRFMQVASTNTALVLSTEIALVFLEFSEVYGYMRLNKSLALLRDVGELVRPSVTHRRALRLTINTSSTPSRDSHNFVVDMEKARISLQAIVSANPGVVPAQLPNRTTSSSSIVTLARMTPKTSFSLVVENPPIPIQTYASVVSAIAVAEGVAVLVSSAFLLLTHSNPYSNSGPIAKRTIWINTAILFVFETLVSDVIVALFNRSQQDELVVVDLVTTWRSRKRTLDFMMFAIIAPIVVHIGMTGLSTLCVDHASPHTALLRCD